MGEKKEKISMKEKLCFGSADLFGGGAQALITAVYLVFLTMNGVPVALAGVIVAIAKIWDAVSDPLMGIISDNTRSRWGRRKPYIFAGAFCVIIALALLFLPLYGMDSVPLKFTIYLVSYLFYNTVSTMICVPYYALSTELSTDYYETNRINAIRLYFSMASSGISSIVPMLLLDKLQDGSISVNKFSMLMTVVFGILYGVPLFLCGLVSKERVPIPEEKTKFSLKSFIKPLETKAFRQLLGIYLCAFTCMDIITSNIAYFAKYGIEVEIPSFVLLAVLMLSYVAMMPVHTTLMGKGTAKTKLIRMGIPFYMIGVIILCLLPSGAPSWIAILLCVIIGMGMSGCQMMPWIIFPDVMDVAELKTGERQTGSYSGLMTFTRKTTAAIAIGLSSLILNLTNFIEPIADADGKIPVVAQPQSAVWGLRLVIMISVIVFISLTFYFAGKLKLSAEVSTTVKDLLEKDKSEYTKEEAEKYEQIKEKLF